MGLKKFKRHVSKAIHGGQFNAGKGGKNKSFGKLLEKAGGELSVLGLTASSFAPEIGVPVAIGGAAIAGIGTVISGDPLSKAIHRPVKSILSEVGVPDVIADKLVGKISNAILPDFPSIFKKKKNKKNKKSTSSTPSTPIQPIQPIVEPISQEDINKIIKDELNKINVKNDDIINKVSNLVHNTHKQLIMESQQLKDINRVNEHIGTISNQITHEAEQNQLLGNEIVEGLNHLDQEEKLVIKELETIEVLERQQVEEQDNLEERILESQSDFKDVTDFYQQIKILDNFDEVLDMLIRQQDNFENLSEQQQLAVVEFISERF